jgi:hypothetical protein
MLAEDDEEEALQVPLHVRPPTTIYVSSYSYICVSLAQMLAEDGKKRDALELLRDALDRTPADVTLATTYALLLQVWQHADTHVIV